MKAMKPVTKAESSMTCAVRVVTREPMLLAPSRTSGQARRVWAARIKAGADAT